MKIVYLAFFLMLSLSAATLHLPYTQAETLAAKVELHSEPKQAEQMTKAQTTYSLPARLPKKAYIEIKNLKFIPRELDITVGTTVIWVNKDEMFPKGRPHMIVAHYNKFRSSRLYINDTFNYTFTGPGTYTYIDPLHKSDRGGLIMGTAAINVVKS